MQSVDQRQRLWTSGFVGISIINLMMFISYHMLTATFPFYIQYIGGDEAVAGVASGLFAVSSVVTRPAAGWILDNKSRLLLSIAGLSGMVLISASYPLIGILALAIIVRTFHGIFWSCSSTAINTVACDIVPRSRFAEGMGIFNTGSAVSMAAGPVLGLAVMNNLGYEALFWGSALFAFVCLIIIIAQHKQMSAVTLIQNREHRAGLFDRNALPAALTMFFFLIPFGAVSTFIALYAAKIDIPNAGIFFILMAVTTILMRVIAGKAADKKGETTIVIYGTVTHVICLLLLAFFPGLVSFLIAALLMGAGFGMMTPAMQAMAMRVAAVNRRGAAASTYLCAFDCGIGFGGLIAGYLLRYMSYFNMFGVMICFTAVSAVVYFFWGRKSKSAFQNYIKNSDV